MSRPSTEMGIESISNGIWECECELLRAVDSSRHWTLATMMQGNIQDSTVGLAHPQNLATSYRHISSKWPLGPLDSIMRLPQTCVMTDRPIATLRTPPPSSRLPPTSVRLWIRHAAPRFSKEDGVSNVLDSYSCPSRPIIHS